MTPNSSQPEKCKNVSYSRHKTVSPKRWWFCKPYFIRSARWGQESSDLFFPRSWPEECFSALFILSSVCDAELQNQAQTFARQTDGLKICANSTFCIRMWLWSTALQIKERDQIYAFSTGIIITNSDAKGFDIVPGKVLLASRGNLSPDLNELVQINLICLRAEERH